MSLSQTFNPSKYSNISSENYAESEEIVTKGHKNILKVDVGKFDDLCKRFKNRLDLKIKSLNGQDKEDFNLMVSYVHLLYGTKYYKHLYERVRKHYANVKSVKPGTIGAYFAGCLVSVKESDSREFESEVSPGCSATCAGSMPLPKDEEGWSFCNKAVILAEKGKNGYVFSVVKPAESEEDLNPAYVFVESNSLNDFRGFAKSEKDHLRAMGCKNIHLVGYDSRGANSYDLYGTPKNVSEIKHRHIYTKRQNQENAILALSIVLIIVFLLLLIGFLGYRYYYTRF